ncbi:hypothetical protein BKA70DRAFT_1510849 [Coprinopsis sp. MPI-PUGE-AT-0042]|nr:hypothetical protein BKA70DRAFT_1510849 [Coprinopsis sp. MPI-PUGE-AT-0042]
MDRGKTTDGFELRLQNIPRMDRSTFTKNFVQEQQLYGKVYTSQGKAYFDNWADNIALGDNIDATQVVSKGDEALDIGVGTPILKPRNPQIAPKTIPRAKTSTHRAANEGDSDASQGQCAPSTSVLHLPPKRAVDSKKKEAKPSSERVYESSKSQQRKRKNGEKKDGERHRSEHAERLKVRRERRKARRDIVNPKEPEPPSSEDEGGPGARKQVGKKPKVPAGLALMHGFHASNVGKSRLTMERSNAPSGLFMKGKASAKTAAAPKSKKRSGFSEQTFLDGFFSKGKLKGGKEIVQESCSSASNSSDPSSKASTLPPPKKKCKRLPKAKVTTEKRDADISSEEEEKGVSRFDSHVNVLWLMVHLQPPQQTQRQVPSSTAWDIERESVALPSTAPSLRTAKPDATIRNAVVPDASCESPSIDRHGMDRASDLSIAPSDSVSRCEVTKGDTTGHGGKLNVVSRFFQTSKHVLACGDGAVDVPRTSADNPPSVSQQDAEMSEEPYRAGPEVTEACHQHSEGPELHQSSQGEQAPSRHEGIPFMREYERFLGQPSDLELEEPQWEQHADGEMEYMAPELLAAPSSFVLSDDNGFFDPLADDMGPADPDLYQHYLGFDQDDCIAMDPEVETGCYELSSSHPFFEPGIEPDAACLDSVPMTDEILNGDHNTTWGSEWPADEDNLQFNYEEDLQQDLIPRVHNEEELDNLSTTFKGHEEMGSVYGSNDMNLSENEGGSNGSIMGCSSAHSTSNGSTEELLPHFLQGRSLLLHGGLDTAPGRKERDEGDKGTSRLQRVETDVARTLKDHWRPQKL